MLIVYETYGIPERFLPPDPAKLTEFGFWKRTSEYKKK